MSNPILTEQVVVGDAPGAPNIGMSATRGTTATLRTDPRVEYVAAGGVQFYQNYARVLAFPIDDVTQDFGADLYERMLLDSKVAGVVNGLRASILGPGLTLRPAVTDRDADGYDQAVALHASYERWLAEFSAETDPDALCWDLSSSIYLGNRVAEVTYDDTPLPGLPRLRVAKIVCKPREAVAFVVDVFGNVIGILGRVPGVGQPVQAGTLLTDPGKAPNLLARRKFLIATFRPKDNDPRGSSVLRCIWDEWNRLGQVKVEYLKYLAQFAGPSLYGTTPEDAQEADALDAEGKPLGYTQTPEQQLVGILQSLRNGSVAGFPFGTLINAIPVGANGGGNPFKDAFELCYQQISFGIESQTLATNEGQHDARAAAEVHQDLRDVIVQQARRFLGHAIYRDVLRPMVAWNDGAGLAALTPVPGFGDNEGHDFGTNAAAVAQLTTAGFLDQSQYPDLDKTLNLPPRAPDWQEQQQERDLAANAAKAALLPPPQDKQAPPAQKEAA